MATIHQLPSNIERLIARVSSTSVELPALQPRKPFDTHLTNEIEDFSKSQKPCIGAALHLLNDDIERAHKIAQDDEADMSSNLCHAILHRREGDFWNSKWWYRQIDHPLIDQFYGGVSKAQSFVDDVESIVGNKSRSGGASTPCAADNLNKLKRKQADELAELVRFVLQNIDKQ